MKTTKTMVLALGLLASASAFAIPITTGVLGMSGTYQAEDAAGNNVAMGSAVAIDFAALNAGAPSSANTGTFVVLQATGDFATAGISAFDFGTIHDLIFSPFAAVTPFFTVGGVTFDMNSLVINTQSNAGITMTGTGTFTHGMDVTSGTWSGSFQTDGQNLTGTFSWSADAAPSVPEPGSLALLGLGLLGLGAARRRRA